MFNPYIGKTRVFLRHFRDPIRVPRIENRVPRIREIGSLLGIQHFLKKKPGQDLSESLTLKVSILSKAVRSSCTASHTQSCFVYIKLHGMSAYIQIAIVVSQ